MTKYRIVDQGSWLSNPHHVPVFAIYRKRWWRWRNMKVWFHTLDEAEKSLQKSKLSTGSYPVVKEVNYE